MSLSVSDYLVRADEVREIPAFHDLPAEQLDSVARAATRRQFAPGQIIFLEGDAAGSLWFVYEGRVRIIKHSLNGRGHCLCLMNRGMCFGSCPLFSMEANPATAQALDAVTLFVLSNDSMEVLKDRDPHLVKALLRIYSQRLSQLARVSEVLGTWPVADRINDCLLTYASANTEPPVVNLTHERLAALSGTVREVVTRHLGVLEKRGIVRTQGGQIILISPDRLERPCDRSLETTGAVT